MIIVIVKIWNGASEWCSNPALCESTSWLQKSRGHEPSVGLGLGQALQSLSTAAHIVVAQVSRDVGAALPEVEVQRRFVAVKDNKVELGAAGSQAQLRYLAHECFTDALPSELRHHIQVHHIHSPALPCAVGIEVKCVSYLRMAFFASVLFRNLSNDSMEERVLGEAVLLQVFLCDFHMVCDFLMFSQFHDHPC